MEDRAEPTCNFTWLVADGTGSFGSTGMYIHYGDLDIFIEAFPASGTTWDPRAVTDADIIIQSQHGHGTHYDASTVAMVAKNTGAYVVGNAALKSDMLAKGVSSSKIVELSPTLGGEDSVTNLLGVDIRAIGMSHTYMSTTQVDTFYVELPNGIKFFHGTCAEAACYDSYMKNRAYLKGLNMMALDFEHNFQTIDTNLYPEVLIKTHTFSVGGVGYLWDDYPQGYQVLNHNDTYQYESPEPNVPPVISLGSASPLAATEDDQITFKVFYRDDNDEAPDWVKVYIKDALGVTTESTMDIVPNGDPWTLGRFMSYSTTLSPGQYNFKFGGHDGEDLATGDLGWHPDTIIIRPRNVVPELQSHGLSPREGDTDTVYRFDVMYRDGDSQEPVSAKVYIDTVPYDMVATSSGPWNDWVTFYCETTLGVGDNHKYYFTFSDGEDSVRLPLASDSPNWLSGPIVVLPNYAPTLTTPLHNPSEGTRTTEFTISVVYTDGENDRPITSNIYIDDVPFMMNAQSFDYRTGAKHTYRTKLDLGAHEYYFVFSDGENTVRLPAEGMLEGPEVVNREPTAVIASPAEGERYTPEDYISFRGDSSSDPDDDDLSFKWTSSIEGDLGTDEALDLRLMEGEHTITLRVEDPFGGEHVMTVDIVVKPYLPRPFVDGIEPSDTAPIEGDVVRFTVQLGNDGEAKAIGEDVTLDVDGEQVGTDFISIDIDASKTLVFTWTATPGPHTVVASIGDDSFDITLEVRANTLPAADPTLINEGERFKTGEDLAFKAQATDVEGDDLTYLWDFGDGITATLEDPSHAYSDAGEYTVTLTITDARGGETVKTFTITVDKPKADESPGFGAALAAVALATAIVGAFGTRRRL